MKKIYSRISDSHVEWSKGSFLHRDYGPFYISGYKHTYGRMNAYVREDGPYNLMRGSNFIGYVHSPYFNRANEQSYYRTLYILMRIRGWAHNRLTK